MNQFQPISSGAVSSSTWDRLSRLCCSIRRALLFWLEDEPATLLHMNRAPQPGVVICYECRRRVTQHEIDAGLHNHVKAAAASGSHAQEQ